VTEAERFFAIFVVLSALLVFSSIVGSISAKITELRQLKLDEVVAQSQLRQYLTDKGISLQLGRRIWHFVRSKRWEYRAQLRESDVKLLVGIPTSLRMLLRVDVCVPAFRMHPFFLDWSQLYPKVVVMLCQTAMNEKVFRALEEVFVEDVKAESMYFIMSGALEYETIFFHRPRVLRPGGSMHLCLSEPAIWGEWIHCGTTVAESASDLLTLETKSFMKVTLETCQDTAAGDHLRKYAQLFSRLVDEEVATIDSTFEPTITDIIEDIDIIARRLHEIAVTPSMPSPKKPGFTTLTKQGTLSSLFTANVFKRETS